MGLPSAIGRKASWQSIASKKRAEIFGKIPQEWILSQSVLDQSKKEKKIVGGFIESLLDSETLRITSLDPADIAEKINGGSLTSVNVVRAFCKRAAIAHQLNNNLLEITFDAALRRAEELDRYFKENKKTVGPLHGLPYTFKDQFHQKGLPATMAYVGWIGTFEGQRGTAKEETTESELVRELDALGAVPIAKAGETNNNILGYNFNPNSQALSSGGSSGGEGALQSLRGSAFGFGTDIGGSVSMPAAYNGIYSLKPSTGRLPFKDVATSSPGQQIIPAVVGALGPSISTLRLVFKSILSTKPWLHDPDCLAIPFRQDEEIDVRTPPKLSFGLFEADGVVTPHPPISRALQVAAKALKAQGHKIISWEPPSHAESAIIHPSFTQADGLGDVLDNVALSGEPLVPQIAHMFANGRKQPVPLLTFFNSTLHLKNFRARYQAYWSSTVDKTGTGRPVDAVILPVGPQAAVIPGKSFYYTYGSFVNVLDYVSIVIPVTTADKNIDVPVKDYKPLSEKDKKTWEAYDAEAYDGAPAAIQLLGRRLEEEKLLSIAQVVVDALVKQSKGSKI
ncbi:amidase [Cadophora sp. DSE1049]|nr:amidase [Cadophora sp. DSE1049]